MITRTRDNTQKPHHFPDHVALFSLPSTAETEPTSFNRAKNLPPWKNAICQEMLALHHNQTWTLVPLPSPNHNIIGCKWVYKLKRKPDGSIDRYKAQFVAKGYNQEERVDYFDTFSLVVRPTTIRLVLSIAVTSDWSIKQLDVQYAFLHSDL
jgi:Reverse transcriptase (RNA-dependent DNA polymerase)